MLFIFINNHKYLCKKSIVNKKQETLHKKQKKKSLS